MNPSIYAILCFFRQILENIFNIANINGTIADREIVCIPFKLNFFFMLSTVKSFEIFPKNNGFFYFRVVCLELIALYVNSTQKVSAIITVSNPFVSPSPWIRIYFFMLWAYIDKLLSTPKITKIFPHSLLGNGNCEQASNPNTLTTTSIFIRISILS